MLLAAGDLVSCFLFVVMVVVVVEEVCQTG